MKQISAETSAKIVNMGFLCAILVVLRHVGTMPEKGNALWWVVKFFDGLTWIAVPFFFLVSGYFLARHFNDGKGWFMCEWKKRVKTLLLPFVLWNALFIVWFLVLSNGARLAGYSIHVQPVKLSCLCGWMSAFGLNPFDNGAHEHLWYLRTLLLFTLMSPLIRLFVVRIRSMWWMVVAYGCLLALRISALVQYDLSFVAEFTCSLQGLGFFIFGAYMNYGSSHFKLSSLQSALLIVCGLFCFLARAFCLYSGFASFGVILLWSGIPATLVGLWHFIPGRFVLGDCTRCAFPLYVLHGFIGLIMSGVIGAFGLRSVVLESSLALYFGRWFVLVLSTLFAVRVIKAGAPRFYNFAFVGRG